ncbi:MAG: VTT domain-containing protein [Pseudomonadota bacterium]
MLRLFWIFIVLALLVLIPFAIWGEGLEHLFSQESTVAWLEDYGQWAWAAGMLLLASDLLLPIPATAIMAALGFVYGPVWGGVISTAGGFLGGTIGYEICRRFGRQLALRLLGQHDLEQGERLFARSGGWLVVLSRWLPVFPEVIACMAGLSRMPRWAFYVALLCGSAPLGFTFAAIGHTGAEHPILAIALSALVPPILWLVVQPLVRAQQRAAPARRRTEG